ncbi:MAG: hypothetical protein ACYCW6_10600 [Candidatus Xenobia bacterium]
MGSPTVQADLGTFCSTFNLPPANLQMAYPSGMPTSTNAAWAMETAMDNAVTGLGTPQAGTLVPQLAAH